MEEDFRAGRRRFRAPAPAAGASSADTGPVSVTLTQQQFLSLDPEERALIEKQHVLSLGMPMVVNEFYVPCTPSTHQIPPTQCSVSTK